MKLEQTFRWFGEEDKVDLAAIKQTGATGIVTALHHIPPGEVWSKEEILLLKHKIESHGLTWTTVESVAVHEAIKTKSGEYQKYLANYRQTLRNLGQCGITTVCYNFMPVLDWTRTHLNFQTADGSYALRFDMMAFVAFDIFMLKRNGADKDYTQEQVELASAYYDSLSPEAIGDIQSTILMGLPGTVEDLSLEDFNQALQAYDHIDRHMLKANYFDFLQAVIPTAEEAKVKMAVHPDDPPMSIFGLPRIVSDENDLEDLLSAVDSPYNGLTFCTGSLGSRSQNNVVKMMEKFADRIHFVHLRNVIKEENGSFYESDHLDGDVDMYEVVKILLTELAQRQTNGQAEASLPIRPDHGHQMLDDLHKTTYPGYSAIGRLRGLAEIRGLELGIIKSIVDQ